MQNTYQGENRAENDDIPAQLAAAILAADVLILIGSSETDDMEIVVKQVYAGGVADPEHVASHAYAHAALLAHNDLVRAVRGEPTDAMRYQALRDFAVLGSSDKPRFEAVNNMLQQFEEESGLPPEEQRKVADFDAVANFLVQAMIETEPVTIETPAPVIELATRIVRAH